MSVTRWRRWALWGSSIILVPRRLLIIWPTVGGVKSLTAMYVVLAYDFNIGELSDVPLRSVASTCLRNTGGKPIQDRILSACPVLFVLGDLITLAAIQAGGRLWFSAYHPFEVTGSKAMSKALEVRAFDVYTAGFGSDGAWDLSDLTGGLDLDHFESIRVDYGQLWEVFSTASISLPTFVISLFFLAVCSAFTLSDRTAVDTGVGALEAKLQTSNDFMTDLELQNASMIAENVPMWQTLTAQRCTLEWQKEGRH